MSETIIAWHFVGDALRDGRPVPPDGEWLTHDGPLVLCESGLHASLDPFDALRYAPGPVLCRVELAGAIVHDDDKVVAARRRIVARRDMTAPLLAFARQCASDVLHLWDAPPVVREYLATGREDLRTAAMIAARAAAWDAASDAASDAARAAAWAAMAAARAAERDAASDAAWDAERAAQRQRWHAIVAEQFGEAV